MRPSEFMTAIEQYWSKNAEAPQVSKAIIEQVKNANAPALKAIMSELQKAVAPNYLIGVKHVLEAANAAGAALTRREIQRFEVECAGCGRSYSYRQGESDGCPFCGMWYIDQYRMEEYKKIGKAPKTYQEFFLRRIDECQEKFQREVAK